MPLSYYLNFLEIEIIYDDTTLWYEIQKINLCEAKLT